ncbi:hypothetical protein AD934_06555 [Gluconobacter oxydans]|uniref:Uncharacterized protein n=1 Tax=Gluconobacter oxydans TaxID=442 RepID=A0A149RX20_GLUOY|nr:hypothetical protein AD934_06555 [Gluconobacter oxydans]
MRDDYTCRINNRISLNNGILPQILIYPQCRQTKSWFFGFLSLEIWLSTPWVHRQKLIQSDFTMTDLYLLNRNRIRIRR